MTPILLMDQIHEAAAEHPWPVSMVCLLMTLIPPRWRAIYVASSGARALLAQRAQERMPSSCWARWKLDSREWPRPEILSEVIIWFGGWRRAWRTVCDRGLIPSGAGKGKLLVVWRNNHASTPPTPSFNPLKKLAGRGKSLLTFSNLHSGKTIFLCSGWAIRVHHCSGISYGVLISV